MRQAWIAVGVVAFGLVAAASAQPAPTVLPVEHDPWLNWDFIVPPGVNDVHIIVDNPTFTPRGTAGDPFSPVGWQYGSTTVRRTTTRTGQVETWGRL